VFSRDGAQEALARVLIGALDEGAPPGRPEALHVKSVGC
jgi:hypothetical protein